MFETMLRQQKEAAREHRHASTQLKSRGLEKATRTAEQTAEQLLRKRQVSNVRICWSAWQREAVFLIMLRQQKEAERGHRDACAQLRQRTQGRMQAAGELASKRSERLVATGLLRTCLAKWQQFASIQRFGDEVKAKRAEAEQTLADDVAQIIHHFNGQGRLKAERLSLGRELLDRRLLQQLCVFTWQLYLRDERERQAELQHARDVGDMCVQHEDELVRLVGAHAESRRELALEYGDRHVRHMQKVFLSRFLQAWGHMKRLRREEAFEMLSKARDAKVLGEFRRKQELRADAYLSRLGLAVGKRRSTMQLQSRFLQWRVASRLERLEQQLLEWRHKESRLRGELRTELTTQASSVTDRLHRQLEQIGNELMMLGLCYAWLRVARDMRTTRGHRRELDAQDAQFQQDMARKERADLQFRDAQALRTANWIFAFGYQAWLATCFRGWREARARARHEQGQERYGAEYARLTAKHDSDVAKLERVNEKIRMRIADFCYVLQAKSFAGTLCMVVLHAWRQAQLIPPSVHQLRLEQGRIESHRHGALVGIFILERLIGPKEHVSLLKRALAALFVEAYSARLRGEFRKDHVEIDREIKTDVLNLKVTFNRKAKTILHIYDNRWTSDFLSVWLASWRRQTADALRDRKLNAWRVVVEREAAATVSAMASGTQAWVDKSYGEISELGSLLLVQRCLPPWRHAAVAGKQRREMDRARELLSRKNASLQDDGRRAVRAQSSKVGGFVTVQLERRVRLLTLSLHALAWQVAASADVRARRIGEYRVGHEEAQQRRAVQIKNMVGEKELAVSRAAALLVRARQRLELARPLLAWQRAAAQLQSSATIEYLQGHNSEELLELRQRHSEGIRDAGSQWQKKCQGASVACLSFEGKMLLYRCVAAWSREVKAVDLWRLATDYEALAKDYEDAQDAAQDAKVEARRGRNAGQQDRDGAQDRAPDHSGGPAAAGGRTLPSAPAQPGPPPAARVAWSPSGGAGRWNAGAPAPPAPQLAGGRTAGAARGASAGAAGERPGAPPAGGPPSEAARLGAAGAAHGAPFGGEMPSWAAPRLGASAPPSDEDDEAGAVSQVVADMLARLTRARVAIGDHEAPAAVPGLHGGAGGLAEPVGGGHGSALPSLPGGAGGEAEPVGGGYASALPPMPELPFDGPDAMSANATALQTRLRSLQMTMDDVRTRHAALHNRPP